MNRLKHILTLTLLVLLATACSKDDDLTPGSNIPTGGDGQQTVTFTVGADYTLEGDAWTRSEGTEEEKPTRCFLQVLDANGTNLIASASDDTPDDKGSFQLSVSGLTTGTTYQFLFWADNASTTISDLKAVPYTPNTVAYAEKVTGTPEEVRQSITLSHVVTKVTLRHSSTNTFTASANDVLTITLPGATYNISTKAAASGSDTQTFTHTFSGNVSSTDTDICTFYTLAPATSGNSVSVNFNMLDLAISSVSLPANNHVILQGDLSEYNTNWTIEEGKEAEYIQEQFEHYFFNGDDPRGTPFASEFCFNGTTTQIQNLLRHITRNANYELPSTSSHFIFGSQYSSPYLRVFNYIYSIQLIYNNGTTSYVWNILEDSDYEALPTP